MAPTDFDKVAKGPFLQNFVGPIEQNLSVGASDIVNSGQTQHHQDPISTDRTHLYLAEEPTSSKNHPGPGTTEHEEETTCVFRLKNGHFCDFGVTATGRNFKHIRG